MVDYIINVLSEFPMKFKETLENVMPAGVDLFSEDSSKKLNEEMRTIFHQTVAQGLFVCKRARPDAQPTIAVSCTRVKAPGERD